VGILALVRAKLSSQKRAGKRILVVLLGCATSTGTFVAGAAAEDVEDDIAAGEFRQAEAKLRDRLNGNAAAKVAALEQIDQWIVAPLLNHPHGLAEWCIQIARDHPTPVAKRVHTSDPPAFCMAGTNLAAGPGLPFNDTNARSRCEHRSRPRADGVFPAGVSGPRRPLGSGRTSSTSVMRPLASRVYANRTTSSLDSPS